MSESINAEFEAYVNAELGDIAVVSEGRYISPKIQNYHKVWQHREAQLEAFKTERKDLISHMHTQALVIQKLEAQLADAKQVANDCRIVADNAIAEAKKYQWKPIETAPKDGTRILLNIDHGKHGDAVWTGLWADGWIVSYGKPENTPTHWMPLPKPSIDATIQAEGKQA